MFKKWFARDKARSARSRGARKNARRSQSRGARLECLEERRVMFATSIHQDITSEALPFIQASVLSDINDDQLIQDTIGQFTQANHFDGSHFQESAAAINSFLNSAVAAANVNNFRPQDVADFFGKILHSIQDFYSHSNWIELQQAGLLPAGAMVDSTFGFWNTMTPYSFHNGAMTAQGEDTTPNTAFGEATLSRTGYIVTVHTPAGDFPGLMTGAVNPLLYGGDDSPDNIVVSHGGEIHTPFGTFPGLAGDPTAPLSLAKDGVGERLHTEARAMALKQTTHEFFRLLTIINLQAGTGQQLLNAWIDPSKANEYNAASNTFVTNRSNAPLTQDDYFVLGSTTGQQTYAAAGGFLQNDQGVNGEALTATGQNAAAKGTAVASADGTFNYTPGQQFAGHDSFLYQATGSASNTATVNVFSHNGALVAKAYQKVLGRKFDVPGLEFWVQQIEGGAGLSAFATGVFESRERLEPIIKSWYRQYLGRPQDPAQFEIDFYYERFRAEGGPQNILPDIFSSPEFFNNNGGTNNGWVTGLYTQIVLRAPVQSEIDFHVGRLNQGTSRQDVVRGFLFSPEKLGLVVTDLYQRILGRDPSSNELQTEVNAMSAGKTEKQLQLQLLDSNEFRSIPAQPAAGQIRRFQLA